MTATAVAGDAGAARAPLPPLAAVRFADRLHGFAAGRGIVLATADGGRTWRTSYRGGADLQSVDAVDGRHAWAVGRRQLLRTTDGGRTWEPAGEPGSPLRGVAFFDSRNGLGVAGRRLHRTADGGVTWTPARASRIDSVCVGSGGAAWAAGGGRVLRSVDGGATWRAVRTRPRRWTATIACMGRRVAYILSVTGGAAGTTGQLYERTLDGGRTWRLVLADPMQQTRHPGVAAAEPAPGALQAIDARHAAVLGLCPPCLGGPRAAAALHTTADAGRHWRRLPVRDRCGPVAAGMWFVDPRHGFLATTELASTLGCHARARGRLLETCDGGRTWHAVLPTG